MGDGACKELKTVVHCRNCPVFVETGRRLFEREPPAAYVEEQTRQLAEPQVADTDDTLAVTIFRIGEEWLAFAVGVVAEVTEPRTVHRIPHRSDRRLRGLVNIRGELHLCFCLGELLGIAPDGDGSAESPSSTARLLVAEYAAQRWALSVDEVAGVYRVGVGQLADVPSTVANSSRRFSRAVLRWEDRSVGYLADDRLFGALGGSIG
jgi:chemotaxis-related protein WspD